MILGLTFRLGLIFGETRYKDKKKKEQKDLSINHTDAQTHTRKGGGRLGSYQCLGKILPENRSEVQKITSL